MTTRRRRRLAGGGGGGGPSTVTFASANGIAGNISAAGTATTLGIGFLIKGSALINLSGANAAAALYAVGDNSTLPRIYARLVNDAAGTSVAVAASANGIAGNATGNLLKSSLSATKYYTISVSSGATNNIVSIYDGASLLTTNSFAGSALGNSATGNGILQLNDSFYANSIGPGTSATYDAVWLYSRELTGTELYAKPAANASGQIALYDFDSGDLTIGGTTTTVANKTTSAPVMTTVNASTTYA